MDQQLRKFINVVSIFAIFLGLILIGHTFIDLKSAVGYKKALDEVAKEITAHPRLAHQSLNSNYVKMTITYALNNWPTFTAGPSDNGSTSTAAIDVDTNVTFLATSTDTDGNDWKLIVCSTSSAPTASTSTPTCAGGAGNLWCVSSSWASSTVGSSCTYSATTSNAEANNWWAFACDNYQYNPLCSTSSQGTGANGSPFSVNHRPSFTAKNALPNPVSAGATITFSASSTDSDVAVATDTVKLFVCKAADATSSGCGAGGTWATSSLTTSNPSATTSAPVAVGSQTYYAYIFDNHNLGAAATVNGTSSTFTISNATPTVSTVIINSATSSINLTENSTTTVTVTATVEDTNGCGDIATTTLKFYRSAKGSSCSADENDCYSSSCAQDGGSCAGGTDTVATYTCLANLWYYADPTDVGTVYADQNWVALVTSQDAATASHFASSTIEVNSLLAFDVSSPIAYGSLSFGATSGQATSTLTNTGNIRLYAQVSGTNMTCSSGSITVGQQHYSMTGGFDWSSGTTLSGSAATTTIDLVQRTTTITTDDIYWKLQAPASLAGGTCSGQNTFTAVLGKAPTGVTCTLASECASGFCVDGYCCNNACAGTPCSICDANSNLGAGTCGYVNSAIDPNSECGTTGCGNDVCSGTSASCGYYSDNAEHNCTTACTTCNGATSATCVNMAINTQDAQGSNVCTADCKKCSSGSCVNQSQGEDLFSDCDTISNCNSGVCNSSGACDWYTSGDGGCPLCHTCEGATSISCVHVTDNTPGNGCTATHEVCVSGSCVKPCSASTVCIIASGACSSNCLTNYCSCHGGRTESCGGTVQTCAYGSSTYCDCHIYEF